MFTSGTIYNYKRGKKVGVVSLKTTFVRRLSGKLLRGSGAGLTTACLVLFLFSFGPIIQQEIDYRFKTAEELALGGDLVVKDTEAGSVHAVQKEAASYNLNSYFSIVIPKIHATSNIIANVDPMDRTDYIEALKQGVAHARGTYFPGQGRKTLLFSHSTDSPLNIARYNAVFYLLRKLEAGDTIIVFFADRKYVYQVTDKHVAAPNDTSWLTQEGSEEVLVLMTCDPPGTTWNRLIVEASPVDKLPMSK